MSEYETFPGFFDLFEAIAWCDQSDSPPADTHALQFMFEHRPHGIEDNRDERLYRGLLFYTPPSTVSPSNYIGSFHGVGFGGTEDTTDTFSWVRIKIRIGRSYRRDEDSGLYKILILGVFSFTASKSKYGALAGGPFVPTYEFESDGRYDRIQGEAGTGSDSGSFHMRFDEGRLFHSQTTALMP